MGNLREITKIIGCAVSYFKIFSVTYLFPVLILSGLMSLLLKAAKKSSIGDAS
jgi:hypothetical protein